MVAIVAGQGLGLQNTSKELLGGGGVLGSASQGVTGEGVYVNAATGNLVVRQQDEWLVGVGPDAGITRTYNSLGAGTDDNGDNWQLGLSRRITGVTGGSGVNTAGSSVKRVGEDGVEEGYTWDAVRAAYVSKSGAGAYDTLKYSTSTADRPYEGWTWTDGDTQQVEHYEGTSGAGAKLKSVVDRDGNKIDLTYDSTRTNLISKIRTTNGSGAGAEEIEVTYFANKNNIESLITKYVDGSQTKTLKRVTYGYDNSDRLNSVKVDLTPDDLQDTKSVETRYTYHEGTKRLKTLEQFSGEVSLSKLAFEYVSASDGRLKSIKEWVNGQELLTQLEYTAAGLTKVKDALGQYTEIAYNDSGATTAADKQLQLKSIKLPTATQALVSYEYDDSSNVMRVTDGRGGETIYRYDSQGNRVYERNAEGNVIERSYGSANELLSETVYAVSDPDTAGAQLAGKPQTTYHVYDDKLHLRYVVNPLGQVTEHRYNELGQRTSTLQYTQGSFTVGAQSSWSDGFNNGLAAWNITGSAYQVVNGKLEATSKQATQQSNWASPQQFKPLGTTWRLEFRTPSSLSASRPVNFGLDSSSGEYRMYRLLIDGGNFKVASQKGSLGIAARTLGAVQPDKDYVLEIVTQASGELQMYVYEAGQDRSGGFVDTANLGLWAGTKFLFETRVDPQASSQPVKYVFDNLSAKTPAVPQLSELDAWRDSASQPQSDKSTVARTDYGYDTRGLLSEKTTQTNSASAWDGARDSQILYTYDRAGNLLLTLEAVDGSYVPTMYAYDGLNRLKVRTDAAWRETVTEYLDASHQVKVTSANGLVTTTTYDEAGHVLTVNQSDPQAQQALQSLGTTKYSYDKLGRLIATEQPGGQKSYIVYDAQGRKVADVDAEFALTEYLYNDAGQVARAIRYVNAVTAAGQQALQARGAGDVVTVASLRKTDTNDRHTVYVYDAAGRLAKTITPNGLGGLGALMGASVQEMRYDGTGQLIETIQYATQLDNTQANQLSANALTLKSSPGQIIAGSTTITLAVDAANDRHVRQFYDAAGRLIGKLDAENYYTAYAYDGAGRLVRTSRYAAAMVGTLQDAQTPPQIVATIASAPSQGAYVLEKTASIAIGGADQHTYRVYDGRGQVSAEIDAEGYVTAYEYDARGNLTQQKRHVNRTVSSAATGSILVGRVWSTANGWEARYVVPNAGDWVTTHRYDELGRRYRTEVQPQGLVTTYRYDELSDALVEVVTGVGAGAGVERMQRMKHDKLGRLTDELNAEGAKALATLGGSATQEQKDAIWKQYGIHHDYDLSGNRIATTTPDGQGVAGLKTVYYYDRNGRLTHSINALGEVSSFVYNRFGEITEERKHAKRLEGVAGVAGGVSTSMSDEVSSALDALRVDGLDQYVQKDYFRSGGLFYSGKDQSDEAEFFEYNAFGELKGSSRSTYVGEANSYLETQHRRNRRGLITETSKQGNFGAVDFGTTYAEYDAFGRVWRSFDARGQATVYIHDRLGRQTRVTEPNESFISTLRTSYSYDAFDRVVSLTEPGGQKTTFVYDDAQRTLTKRVPLDWVTNSTQYIETVTKQDVHGQTVEIKDGRGYRRKFEYDLNGQLTKQELRDASDNLLDGEHKKNEYDKAGRLIVSWDKNQKVTIAYDKANRVLTRTVDAGAELLSSEYRYDALGQAVWTRDAAGVWTHTEYNQQGRVKRVTIDPLEVPKASEVGSQASASNVFALEANPKGAEAVNQVSEFSYSFTGELSRVTKGQGSATEVVAYVFDELGRRVAEIKDPDGLKLRTDYTYDKNGNVVARKDALGQVTRYVYDLSNRVAFEIDATGAVVRHDHDRSGNVSRRVAYQGRLSQAGLAGLALEVDRATIEGLLPAQPQSGDQVSYQFYDAANRLTMSVDALGHVTERAYDKTGNLAKITRYANAVLRQDVAGTALSDRLSFKAPEVVGPNQSPANSQGPYVVRSTDDQSEQYVYDGANRLTWKVDALGYATRYDYFGHGPSVTEIRYANAVKYPTGSTELAQNVAPQVLWQEPTNPTAAYVVASGKDVGGGRFYDGAGRLATVQDAEAYFTVYTYDGAGRVRKVSRPVEPFSLEEDGAAITSYAYDGAGRLIEVTDAEGVKTRHKYDAAGNRTETTVAYDTPDASTTGYTYDDAGRLTAETRAKGTSEESTTSYVLNALGQRKEIIDPRGYHTLQDFDEAGRVKQVTDPLGGKTITEYDAFGNAVKVTDPNGNAGYFFFDANNRNTWQVDPMGYATKTVYDAFGQAREITKYDGAVKGTLSTSTKLGAYASAQDATAAGSTAYVLVNADKDAKTTIWHDKLGRQTQIQDAEGHTEEMAYDGLGNKVKFTNKLSGVFTYTHDLMGRVLTETQPVTVKQYDAQGKPKVNGSPIQNLANTEFLVVTRFQYDSRGNVVKKTEAEGLAEQRVTEYGYDKLDRLKTTTGQAMGIYTVAGGSDNKAPVETRTYDKRGNLVELKTADGARTLSYYDDLNRKVAQLQAVQKASDGTQLGVLTQFAYTEHGGTVTTTTHDTLVSMPVGATSSLPEVPLLGAKRKVVEQFDANQRLIRTTIPDVKTGEVEADDTYKVRTKSLIAERFYDKNGNLIRELDARGNATYHYYDRAGNLVASVDPLRYLTIRDYDASGALTREAKYATPLSASSVLDLSAASLQSIRAAAVSSNLDRVTEYELDKLDRVKVQRTLNVEAYTTSASGVLSTDASTSSTSFTYDGAGNVLTKTDALNGTASQQYDKMGREIKSESPSYAGVTPTTLTEYDAFGQIISITRKGASASDDRVEKFSYDKNGHQKSQTDAAGAITSFQVDLAGRITRKTLTRTEASGASTSTDVVEYDYDLLGRQIQQKTKNQASGANQAFTLETRETRYDAFGSITASGWNGGWQVFNEYDNAGRLIKTNQGGGVAKAYVRDANGNATLQIDSTGANLRNLSIDEILGLPAGELVLDQAASGQLQADGTALTISIYDKRNQLVETRQPTLTTNAEKATVTQTLSQAQSTAYAGGVVGVGSAFNGVVASAPSTEGIPTNFVTVGDVTTTVTSDVRKHWYAKNISNWLGRGDGNPHYERGFSFRMAGLPPQIDVFQFRIKNNSFVIDFTFDRRGGPVRLNDLAHGLQSTDISYDWSSNSINVGMYGHLAGDNSWSQFYNSGNFLITVDGQLTSPQDAINLFYEATPFMGDGATVGKSVVTANDLLILPPVPQGAEIQSVLVATETGPYELVKIDNPENHVGTLLADRYAVRFRDMPAGTLKFLITYSKDGGSLYISGTLINRRTSPSISINTVDSSGGESVSARIINESGKKKIEFLRTVTRYIREGEDSLTNGAFYYRKKGGASVGEGWISGDFTLANADGSPWGDGEYEYMYTFQYRKLDGDHELVEATYHGGVNISNSGANVSLTPSPVSEKFLNSTVHFRHLPENASTMEVSIKRTGDSEWRHVQLNVVHGFASLNLLRLFQITGNETFEIKYTIHQLSAMYGWRMNSFLASGVGTVDLSNKETYQTLVPDMAPTTINVLPSSPLLDEDSSSQQLTLGTLSDSIFAANASDLNTPAGWEVIGLVDNMTLAADPVGGSGLIRKAFVPDWAGSTVSLRRSTGSPSSSGGAEVPPASAYTLKANTTYTISVWAKLEQGTVPTTGSLLKSSYHDGSGTAIESLDFKDLVLDGTWRKYSITFTNHQELDYKAHIDELLSGLPGIPAGVPPWQAPPRPVISVWGYQVIEATTQVASGNDPSSSAWTKTGTSVSNSTVKSANSDGVVKKVEETASTGAHQLSQQVTIAAAGRYTYALDLKAGERGLAEVAIQDAGAKHALTVDLSTGQVKSVTGSVVSTFVTPKADGWYTVSLVVDLPDGPSTASVSLLNASGALSYAGTAGAGLYVNQVTLSRTASNAAALLKSETAGKLGLAAQPVGLGIKFDFGQAGSGQLTHSVNVSRLSITDPFAIDVSSLIPPGTTGKLDYTYTLYADAACTKPLLDPVGNPVTAHGSVNVAPQGAANDVQWTIQGMGQNDKVIKRKQTYNAFGEVLTETDGRGNLTELKYNNLGKLSSRTTDVLNHVKADSATGVSRLQGKVTTTYRYDLLGRLVGTIDANGNVNTQQWLAGDSQRVTKEFHADGGIKQSQYDIFGDLRTSIDEVNRTTKYSYNKRGEVVTVERPVRPSGDASVGNAGSTAIQLIEYYGYDEAGHRVSHRTTHMTAAYGANTKELTDYDALGRVRSFTTFGGAKTEYAYTYDQVIKGVGGLVVGGYVKKTTQADGRSSSDRITVFGETSEHTDFGGNVFVYSHDHAGRLTSQTSQQTGQNIQYEYYANGYIKTIRDLTLDTRTGYEYDEDGNRTREYYQTGSGNTAQIQQDATISYDAANRVTAIHDGGADIRYEYDANGNRIRVLSYYHDGVNGSASVQDYWYEYDRMNRFTITKGSYDTTSKRVVAGAEGTIVGYDQANQRVSAATDGYLERYTYSADGYLIDTMINGSLYAHREVDLSGRTTAYKQYDASGTLSRNTNYDADNRLLSQSDSTTKDGKVIRSSTTTYSYYNSQAEDKSQISTTGKGQLALTVTEQTEVDAQNNTSHTALKNYRTYQWWDDAKVILQTADNATVSIEAKKSKAGYSYSVSNPGGNDVRYASGFAVHTYDVNGHLMRVDDPANQTAGVTDKGRSIEYVTNAQGLIMKRTELANGNANPSTGIVTGGSALKFRRFYYLDGKVVGDVSNNSKDQSQTSYAEQMAAIEQAEQNKGKDDRYKRWQPIASANFDQNYLPINTDYPGNASYNYTVRSNSETLQSIALSVWGDAAMWYLIAEANGLKADTTLIAGQALTIPNKVTNVHNNSNTYRVYDAGAAIGDVSPTAPFPPPPPPPKKGCGGTGMVLMIVVAVVATVLTAGAAAMAFAGTLGAAGSLGAVMSAGMTVLGGGIVAGGGIAGALAAAAIGGAAGSIASQAVGMATGNVEKFSWSAVAKGALTSAASAGAGQALNSLSQSSQIAQAANIQFNTVDGVLQAANTGTAVARAVTANVFAQGLSMAVGMQRKFDWKGVAASAVGSAAGQAAGALTRGVDLQNGFANQVFGGTVQNMASGWAQSAAYEQRPAWAQLAASSFGSALGDAVVGSIVQAEREKQQRDQMYGLASGDGKPGLKVGGYRGPRLGGDAALGLASGQTVEDSRVMSDSDPEGGTGGKAGDILAGVRSADLAKAVKGTTIKVFPDGGRIVQTANGPVYINEDGSNGLIDKTPRTNSAFNRRGVTVENAPRPSVDEESSIRADIDRDIRSRERRAYEIGKQSSEVGYDVVETLGPDKYSLIGGVAGKTVGVAAGKAAAIWGAMRVAAKEIGVEERIALKGAGLTDSEIARQMDVLGDIHLFRGTSVGYPGNPVLQKLGITPASTDPLVATVFGLESKTAGGKPVLLFGERSSFGSGIDLGNVRSGLEREVQVNMTPLEFAKQAPYQMPIDTAREILRDMRIIELPPVIRTPQEATRILESTPRMTPEQILEFMNRARNK